MGRENKKWRRCQLAITQLCALPALSFPFSVFSKLCIMNTPLHFLLLCQSCRSIRNVSFGGHILGLMKSPYHGWLSMMTSPEGRLFSLASGSLTLNPPLTMCTSYSTTRKYTSFYDRVFTCLHNSSLFSNPLEVTN